MTVAGADGSTPPVTGSLADGGGADSSTPPLSLTPGSVGIRVEQARLASNSGLQVVVTVGLGAGTPSIPLDPAYFHLITADGLTHTKPTFALPESSWWVDGTSPPASGLLSAGQSDVRWRLEFSDIKLAGSPATEISIQVPSGKSENPILTAKASVTVEACAPCAAVCTYLDRDTNHCGACGEAAPADRMVCESGKRRCRDASLSVCGNTCADLKTDGLHCGACGVRAPSGGSCVAGVPTCPAGSTPSGTECLSPGWRVVTSNTTATLNNIWGSSASDIWAVGAEGTIMHYDGSAWSPSPSNTTNHFYGVWGRSSADVWVVGRNGTVMRNTGGGWVSKGTADPNSLDGIWGAPGGDEVWVAGTSGTLRRFKGVWMDASSPTSNGLYGVWGSSASDIWAVGRLNTIVHYDGTAWAKSSTGANHLYGVWGSSLSNVWSVGALGTILRFNGSAWTRDAAVTTNNLLSVWGSSSSDVWAVGDAGTILRFNGSSWVQSASNSTLKLNDVWGSSASNIWAVGDGGTILHYSL